MRLFVLTVLTMIAFAANSVLNRIGVGSGLIEPVPFAVIRLLAGAVTLAGLVVLRRVWHEDAARGVRVVWGRRRAVGAGALLVYLFGFSVAYGAMDAGVGALILFGCVQITMFAGAVLAAEPVPGRRWAGAALAFGGLVVLLSPGGGAVSVLHAASMAVAGIGWGVYSLAGRGEPDALGATAANFVLAVPVGVVVLLVAGGMATPAPMGVMLALLSGAVTSGMGYALWYTVLPQLGASRAAVAQLTVPLIAALAGMVLIGERVGLRFGFAAALVLGGVALASLKRG